MVRLCLLGDDRWGEIYDGLKNSFYGIDSYVADNQIKLTFSPEDICGSTCFDFVVLVRKYGNKGAPDALLIFDKAPGEGHFRFEAGSVTYIPRVSELPNLSMKFDHAIVYYNQGNEERAKDIGEAFEYAYDFLQRDFSEAPSQDFKIYIYMTQEDLVEGLVQFSGFSRNSANFFRSGGAPRPIGYKMHVSPSFGWLEIAHELTHAFIEEFSGRSYVKIKWLDEGLADYEAWKCASSNPAHSKEADVLKTQALNIVQRLKTEGKLYSLNELATEEQWMREMASGHSEYIYSQSFLVVSYLVSSYGLDRTKEILKKVQDGRPASVAVKEVLGKTEAEILNEFTKASESEIFRIHQTTSLSTLMHTTSIIVSETYEATTAEVTATSTASLSASFSETTSKAVQLFILKSNILVGVVAVIPVIAIVIVALLKRKSKSKQ
jgi:hypothetical protein